MPCENKKVKKQTLRTKMTTINFSVFIFLAFLFHTYALIKSNSRNTVTILSYAYLKVSS
jgi:hypothetical protein